MNHCRSTPLFVCLLASAALVPVVALASSATVPGRRVAPASVADASQVQSGRVSAVDLQRKLLVVDGQVYRLEVRHAAFSDDRAKPADDGIASLRPGTKVIVRSARVDGSLKVIQLVVRD